MDWKCDPQPEFIGSLRKLQRLYKFPNFPKITILAAGYPEAI
jgi:hypothetical protein